MDKEHLINFLKTYTNLEIVDKGNWFYAIYYAQSATQNIAFRADFDALPMDEVIDLPWASQFPGKAHKCGHDGHAATLAGLALEVDQMGADKNIFFLFSLRKKRATEPFNVSILLKHIILMKFSPTII
ncbi:N-acetyldiaminopimelate deacetylase [Lysinibacillus sphaericus]